MSATGPDHYSTLGVPRTASAVEIRAAYFRLVRVHTPEDAPERFQAISEAYRVLADPVARKELDSALRLPADVAAALERAAALAEERPGEAVEILYRLLGDRPGDPEVRFAVAIQFVRAGHAVDAVAVLEPLADEHPARAEFRLALADAYLRMDRFDTAERVLLRAVDLAPSEAGVYLMLAHAHEMRDHTAAAVAALDRGILALGGGELRDLPLRLAKVRVFAGAARFSWMAAAAEEIRKSLAQDDDDARRHVAESLYQFGDRYAAARAYDVAKELIDLGLSIEPHEGMRQRSSALAAPAATAAACRRAHGDPRLGAWIRALLPAWFGRPPSEEQWARLCGAVVDEFGRSPAKMRREWAAFRGHHPEAATCLEAAVEQLGALRRDDAGRATSERRRRTIASAAGAEIPKGMLLPGLLVVFAAVLGIWTCASPRDPASSGMHAPAAGPSETRGPLLPEFGEMTTAEIEEAAKDVARFATDPAVGARLKERARRGGADPAHDAPDRGGTR